jgi:hypothetical protein
MRRKTYHWNLKDVSNEGSIMRYCHNCGKSAIFKDSKKRRRNANGKTIFEYAIYKCQKDHTWNLPMSIYKSVSYMEQYETGNNVQAMYSDDILNLSKLNNEGIKLIEIILEEVTGRWRIDKALGERIQDLSRNKLVELIAQERVLVDGKAVKQDYLLKAQQEITILLEV